MMFLVKEELLTYGYSNEGEKAIHVKEMEARGFDIYKETEYKDDPLTPYIVTYIK